MSEDEKDVDVESDDVPEVGMEATTTTSNSLDLEVSKVRRVKWAVGHVSVVRCVCE